MRMLFLAALLAATLLAGNARAEEEAWQSAGREIFEQHRDAVIRVSAVLKMQFSGMGAAFGEGHEEKIDAIATIIDPKGLAVLSHVTIDPMGAMMQSGMMDQDFQAKSNLSDVKMELADGRELAAKLVLKDPDLDLAFLVPEEEPEEALPFIDLSKGGDSQVLDRIISINRMGKAMNRQASLSVGYVSAIVERPRRYINIETAGLEGLGMPAFTLAGEPLGIWVLRQAPGVSQSRSQGAYGVVLPAGDVLDIAAQAREKKSPEEGTGDGEAAEEAAPESAADETE